MLPIWSWDSDPVRMMLHSANFCQGLKGRQISNSDQMVRGGAVIALSVAITPPEIEAGGKMKCRWKFYYVHYYCIPFEAQSVILPPLNSDCLAGTIKDFELFCGNDGGLDGD